MYPFRISTGAPTIVTGTFRDFYQPFTQSRHSKLHYAKVTSFHVFATHLGLITRRCVVSVMTIYLRNWTAKEFSPRELGFPIVTCDAVHREWIRMVVNQ